MRNLLTSLLLLLFVCNLSAQIQLESIPNNDLDSTKTDTVFRVGRP